MDAILAQLQQLESRLDAHGLVTDPEFAEAIRAENDWIEEDETPVIRRGAARGASELDALQAELAAHGLSLPADYRAFLERCGGLALDVRAADDEPNDLPPTDVTSGLWSRPQLATFPDGAPPRLVFFDNGELGYFAFEYGPTLRLVDQSGDWAGAAVQDSCTVMRHGSFTEWLETYVEWGLMTFSYKMVDE
ncbi:MAG: SMI1/KNR4 family protein [Myxococcota bacterium]